MYVVLIHRNKLDPGLLTFHRLQAGLVLFSAEMDVPALLLWHPKLLCHVVVYIMSWSVR